MQNDTDSYDSYAQQYIGTMQMQEYRKTLRSEVAK